MQRKKTLTLDINITAVTSEATVISERLMKTKDLLGKGNYISLHIRERDMQKKDSSC
jgi:hypothetical protein